MALLNKYSKFLDLLTKILRVIIITLLAAMVIIMTFQSIMRYVFSHALPWCEELTLYLSMLCIMLALGIACRKNSHLEVDFITRLYSPRFKCLTTALFSVVAIVVMIIFGKYTLSLIDHATGVSVTMPITMGQIYYVYLVGAIVVCLYSIEIIFRNIVGFFNGGELPPLPSELKEGEDKK